MSAAHATPPTRAELCTDAFFQNPYPMYARLRAAPGPYWLPHQQDTPLSGLWLFSRHADGEQLFKQSSAVSKDRARVRPSGAGSVFDHHLLHRDGADHLRLRRLVAGHFGTEALARFSQVVAEETDAAIDALQGRGEFCLVADYAEPLPLAVAARWIGVPRAQMQRVRGWALDLADGFDSLLTDAAVLARLHAALAAFLADCAESLERAARAPHEVPAHSLLAHLAAARERGEISVEEAQAMLALMFFASHETTVSLVGSGLALLLTHPEQLAALRAEPALMGSAIEEVLRLESPEQRTSFRIVREPVEIGGVRLEPGQQVGAIIGSLNRDEAVFAEPDRFDIRRSPNRHLAFGVGLHHCQGKGLARAQGAIAIGRLLERLPGLALASEPLRWRRNSFFRSLQSLPARRG